jgi:predicted permease
VLGDLEEAHRRRAARHRAAIARLLTGLEALDMALALVRGRLRVPSMRSRSPGPLPPRPRRGRSRSGVSWLDVKLGLRMLVKHPALTVVGGLGLAVAIAIGAGFFGFFYSHLFPALPLPGGERIVALENWDVEANNEERQSLRDYPVWREALSSFEELGAFRTVTHTLVVPGGPSEPVTVAAMTASGFRVAGVAPLLGRLPLEEDERVGAPPVLVIGYDVWETRFGGDPGIVGREVRLGGVVHTVVGVMPGGFGFPMIHRYWTPLATNQAGIEWGEGPEIFIFGRLAPGATREDAQAELTGLGQRAASLHPETHAQLRPQVLPYTYPLIDIQDIVLWKIGLSILIVSLALVVVAVNVAVLAWARTAMRRGEIAVRSALGASRRRIVAQLFVEALVLSAGAAVVGTVLAHVGLRLGNAIMWEETGGAAPFWVRPGLPPATFLYIAGLTVLAAAIVGVVPALQATGRSLQASLRPSSGGTGIRLGRTWTVLIVAQVAIAVAGLPVAVAMGWSEIRQGLTAPTFAADEFFAMRILLEEEPPPGANLDAWAREIHARYSDLKNEMMRRLEREPGVAGVTFAGSVPGSERRASIEVEGVPLPGDVATGHPVRFGGVDVRFFDAIGVPIAAGRPFHAGDVAAPATVVIVNRTFAERILGGANAVGRRFRYVTGGPARARVEGEPPRWYEVVGVVGDLNANRIDPALNEPTLYHPVAFESAFGVLFLVRAREAMQQVISQRLQETVTTLDPTLRLTVRSLTAMQRQERLATQLLILMLAPILASVLLLSAAGIYALMSFTVTKRRKEIVIRAALGANPHRLLGSIFSRAAGQLAIGVVLGAALAIVLDRLTRGELLAGAATVILPAIAALVMAVGLVATLGPARRGLRIQPTEALKEE